METQMNGMLAELGEINSQLEKIDEKILEVDALIRTGCYNEAEVKCQLNCWLNQVEAMGKQIEKLDASIPPLLIYQKHNKRYVRTIKN